MASLAELQTRLAKYEAALDALLCGEAVQDVWARGTRMRYTAANIGDLRMMISQLKAEIAALDPTEAPTRTRSAMPVYF